MTLNFNHLRNSGIWSLPCPIKDVTQKLQFEPKDTAQTHALGLTRSSRFRPSIELQHSLASQVAAISPSVELVMRFVAKFRKVDGSEAGIEMALHEALANAVVHGNREDSDKLVEIACRCSIDGEVSITVRDQGQGFDSDAIPDPTAPENQMSNHGRGIYIMRASMDEINFEEGGVVVRMRKKANAAADQHSRIRRNQK
jgi:anti-sigma regulatory factor (Ser/Thr protein kinase)